MPHKGSPFTILRSRRTNFQATEETSELDFRLGVHQGVELYAVEFGLRSYVLISPDDAEDTNQQIHMSLHVETGALEGSIDSFPADDTILNSEIIAETTLYANTFKSSVAAASGMAYHSIWLQPKSWNYMALLGEPLVIGQNVTFRGVTSDAIMTALGAQVTIFYKIVDLTTKQIVNLFAMRR